MSLRILHLGRQRDARSPRGGLVSFIDQLLELLATEATRDEGSASQEFREQIDRFRAEIIDATVEEAASRIGEACVEACRQHLAARQASLQEREAGYRGLIELLRDTLTTVAAESGAFQASLVQASDRVTALVSVEDIDLLKQRLTHEVREIKRVVVEKQQEDKALQERLAKRVRTLESSLAESRSAAAIDPLTQIANRREFDATLQRWLETRQGPEKSFVLVLIDLDHFKQINDASGHQAGDRALHAAAQQLTAAVRPSDLVARYGGDEFGLLLANMGLDQAEERVPRIVALIARTEFRDEASPAAECYHLTISCGLAESGAHDTAESLIRRADEALYAAKKRGRNCAVAKRAPRWPGRAR